jgi:hypothetical protein
MDRPPGGARRRARGHVGTFDARAPLQRTATENCVYTATSGGRRDGLAFVRSRSMKLTPALDNTLSLDDLDQVHGCDDDSQPDPNPDPPDYCEANPIPGGPDVCFYPDPFEGFGD